MNPNAKSYVHPKLEDLVRLQFEARGFTFLPRQPVDSLLSGRHASRLRGRGLTFEELRDYRPGDDIRAMDWKATARLRKPYVRIYSEERERPVLLVVDQRSSMFFGSTRTTKATTAVELAAVAAWRTLAAGDRVGMVAFGDRDMVEIKPHRSRGNVLRICERLVTLNQNLAAPESMDATPPDSVEQDSTTSESIAPQAIATDYADEQLNHALRRATRRAKHDHLVLLLTDYHGDNEQTQQLVTQLAAHNDVIAALVYDPLGIQIPVANEMMATDGKRQVQVPPSSPFATRFRDAFLRRSQQIQNRLTALKIPILPVCTDEPVVPQILRALGNP